MMKEEKPYLEELRHYGTKGMKWGTRRGSLGSRLKGGLADRNHNTSVRLTRIREGRAIGVGEKLDSAVSTALSGGKTRRNKNIDKQLNALKAQRERLKKGKLKTGDILEIAGSVPIGSLFVSIRDNRG
jgi:hypothetical protein